MKKLTLLLAGAAGYVLGSRAGRERYEQIKSQSTKIWNNPKVQETVADVQAQAKTTGSDVGSKVGSKLAETASDVKSKVSDKLGSEDSDDADFGSVSQVPVPGADSDVPVPGADSDVAAPATPGRTPL
ncbi:MAG: hypothetical protein JWP31_253 [Aeromicrobium sp.]|nr:hypothetical protein [Aeromicrobium sp.]